MGKCQKNLLRLKYSYSKTCWFTGRISTHMTSDPVGAPGEIVVFLNSSLTVFLLFCWFSGFKWTCSALLFCFKPVAHGGLFQTSVSVNSALSQHAPHPHCVFWIIFKASIQICTILTHFVISLVVIIISQHLQITLFVLPREEKHHQPFSERCMNSDILEEACDVFFGAGRPSERRAVVHQLSGHDERVPPFQLAVVPLAIMMNSKAALK